MRIVVVMAVNPYYSNGAAANRWCTLLDGLIEHGVSINLILWRGYQSKEEKRAHFDSGGNGQINVRYLSPLILDSLLMRRLDYYIIQKIITPWLYWKSLRLLKNINVDVLWCDHELAMYKFAVYWKSKYPNTVLFSELNEFMDIHRYNVMNAVQYRQGERRAAYFEKHFLPRLDGIAFMTKTLLNHYQARLSKNTPVIHIPMTVDLKRFKGQVKSASATPYIAYLGVMSKQKDGIDILIDAFARIANRFPDHELRLFGFYHHDLPSLMQQAENLGLEKRIVYLGEKNKIEVVKIIMDADLVVLPRPDSHQARGGFPTKLGEYLASGTPVCSTRVGEIPLYLEDSVSVYFAEPDSVDSFSDAMSRALSNPEKSKEIAKRGQKIAESNFSKAIQANKLHNFIKEILHVKK